MKRETAAYWRRILIGNVIASTVVVLVFSGVTWRTPSAQIVRAFGIAMLFSTCIGPIVGFAMPRIAPWIWSHVPFPFNWAVVTLAMVGFAMVGTVIAVGVLIAIGFLPAARFGEWISGSLRISIALTLTIGLFITAYEVMRARVAAASAQAQLASLESRVQPHFLFNTLNSIAALIPDDPKGAERMTGQLASLLRTSLDQDATPLVALDEELKTVRDYLAIEQVRFGGRLRFDIHVDGGTNHVRVPRLALQTLVENSVKHAVSPRREGASIAIRATTETAQHKRVTHITVEDDGPGFDAERLPAGHGLALLRDRVALLFRGGGALRIDSAQGRTRITLSVPETHDIPAPRA